MNENRRFAPLPEISAELAAMEEMLAEEFRGDGFLQRTASSLVLGGGKRLRPALTIAAAHVGTYHRETALRTAAAMEVLHAATLVHDDVIDHADTRRGRTTLHNLHGNHVAIYAGDFMLAKALKLLSKSKLPLDELSRLSAAIEAMCSGEVAQYLSRNKLPSYREYIKRILSKTGILFAAACAAGGRCGGLADNEVKLLWKFGIRFGTAFQIRDDLLDCTVSARAGKPTGQDLLQGVVTLPLVLAAQDAAFNTLLTGFLQGERTEPQAWKLLELAREAGGERKAYGVLEEQLRKGREALSALPQNRGRELLEQIMDQLYSNAWSLDGINQGPAGPG